jgi:hypothetical protein
MATAYRKPHTVSRNGKQYKRRGSKYKVRGGGGASSRMAAAQWDPVDAMLGGLLRMFDAAKRSKRGRRLRRRLPDRQGWLVGAPIGMVALWATSPVLAGGWFALSLGIAAAPTARRGYGWARTRWEDR